MTVDELQVLITANSNQLHEEINKVNKTIGTLSKSATKSSNGIMSAFKTLKTGIIALGIGKVIKDSIQHGMDAVESDNLFAVSLKQYANDVYEWSDSISNALGLNAVLVRKNTGVIFNMTTSMGLAEDNALKMSKGVAILAEDMASFYNISSEQAFEKIQSGLTGMSKPLKDLGILVDDNTIKQVAYSEGIAKNGTELTEQQKVLARYVALLKQTKNAQGDLARTLDSPANLFRRLGTEIKNCSTSLANIFLPIIQTVVPYMISLVKVITTAINGLATFLGISTDKLSDNMDNVNTSSGGIGDNLDDANKKAKKLSNTLASFDEITNLNTNEGSADNTQSVGGGVEFNLSDYEAGLSNIDDKTKEIVDKINNMFGKINIEPLKTSLDDLWQSFLPFTSNIFDGLKWGYDNILVPLGNFTITEILPRFMNILAGAFDFINAVINECKPAFSWLWDNFLTPLANYVGGNIIKFLDRLSDGLKWLANNIGFVTDVLVALAGAWLGIKALGIVASIVQFVKYAGVLSGTTGLGAVLSAFAQLGTYLKGAWVSIVAVAKGVITALTGGLTALAGALGISVGWLLAIIAAIALVAVGIYELITNWDIVKNFFLVTVPEWWNAFTGMVATAWENVKKWFADALNNIVITITNFFTVIIPKAWNNFLTWLEELPYKLGYFFGDLLATVVLGFINIVNEIVKFFTVTIPNIWNNFTTWIGELLTSIGSWFVSLGVSFVTWLGEIGKSIINFFTVTIPNAWNTFKTWASEIPAKLKTFFTITIPTKFNELIDYIKGLPAKFIEFGKNIVNGLLDGITNAWTNLVQKFNDFISGFIEGFKNKLGIHSPSTVFAEFGENITEGLSEGIGDGNGAFDGLDVLSEDTVETIKNNWGVVPNWFKENVLTPLTSVFDEFSVDITNIFQGIVDMIKGKVLMGINMMNVMIDSLQISMNSVVKAVNQIIRSINATSGETGISLPYAKTQQLDRVPIPKLARGGIIDKPTVAMIGEQGKEAVIPIENNTEWLDVVASKVATMIMAVQENSNSNLTVNCELTVDGKTLARTTIKDINKEAIRQGYKPLLVT